MTPLCRFPDRAACLPPRYYGEVAWYALAAAFGNTTMAWHTLYDKRQKSAHRCSIADKQGVATLTASITKPHGINRATWADVALSDHGAWWRVHRATLATAYGRTPFFEFYIDRFDPFLTDGVTDRYHTLAELGNAIDMTIRQILDIAPPTQPDMPPPDVATADVAAIDTPPYWQVRADRLGFIGNLSVLDLIFNLGPEAPLYLKTITDRLTPAAATCGLS